MVSFNTLRERGLERFADPQKPLEVVKPKAGRISSAYYQPNLGGDMAAVRCILKALLQTHREHITSDQPSLFDDAFIAQNSAGVDEYLAMVDATSWGKSLSSLA